MPTPRECSRGGKRIDPRPRRHKNVRSQRGGEFVQCGHFEDKGGGVLQMWISALFGAKNLGIFEIYGVSARTKGRFEPVRTFCGQEEKGGQFYDYLRSLFLRRYLWLQLLLKIKY